ncbi:MAG TPA: hypothetical protein VHO84_00645 [Syntrophorhabdaceae bacterium]|nr:hypothetical protein [Syntrophorhabdaceae bacterium]
MAFNIYGPTGHFEYPTGSVWAAMTDIVSNERNQLSDIDILAVSQVSKFTTFGMNQSTVPIIIDIQSITKKARTITVTILSSTDFEPTSEIDRATMTFGSTGTEAGSPTCVRKQKDANGDTKLDLACKFAVTKDLGLVCGINEGILKGKMVDGTPFEGSHTFSVRGCQ